MGMHARGALWATTHFRDGCSVFVMLTIGGAATRPLPVAPHFGT
jgi:hypothetical protein